MNTNDVENEIVTTEAIAAIPKRRLTKAEIQEKLLNRKKRMQKFEGSLPDLEDLDDQLAFLELSALDVEYAQNASKGADGEPQEVLALAGMIARALVVYDTKERIFTDDHRGSIAEWGLLVLQPIGAAIRKSSGIAQDALEAAKKN
jgi:hypothetical protein